jgi:phospholipase C
MARAAHCAHPRSMPKPSARASTAALLLLLAGCSPTVAPSDDAGSDAARPDAGPPADVGIDAHDHDVGAPPDGGPPPVDDPLAADREACTFAAGAMVADTLPDVTAARAAITHIVVIMQENRSFDHMFGTLGHGTEGTPSDYVNVDGTGTTIAPWHESPTCGPDVPHSWTAMHTGWDDGAMDGWARSGGRNAMGYLTDEDHPFYTWMATTFSMSDRYFASVIGPTHPNRAYLYGGTSDGIRESYAGHPSGPFVFDSLDAASVEWAEFNASSFEAFSGTLPLSFRNIRPYSEFLPALADGTLPPVSFVDLEPNDEHPPGSVHDGEIAMHPILEGAFASPLWPHLAILFTYDEGGGYFDHVRPPSACLAAPSESAFDTLGPRVPLVVISPYARAAFVSHRVHSHTSILRFIEAIHDLPAITGRDANSDALLDLFDFETPPFASPPVDMPPPGARDC